MCVTSIETESNRWTPRDIVQMVFFALFIKPVIRLFIGCRVDGKDRLPKSEPFVLIANHSSHLDTVSLLSLFPLRRLRRIHPVAAADYFACNSAISWLSRTLFNILPIERHRITAQNNPVDRMIATLRAGRSLILFPEGTRGSGETVGEFRAGIAHLVKAIPNLKVIPAYLENTGRCLPKGTFLPVPLLCEIKVGEPLTIHGNRREILEEMRAAVCGLREEDGITNLRLPV